MSILSMILTGIGIVVGLIVLTVLLAFLVELVKAFGQIGKWNCGKNAPKQWCKTMVERLSIKLFGAKAIDK